MQSKVYAHLAAAYGGEEDLIVVTDRQLCAVYFNGKASRHAAFTMKESFIQDVFSAGQCREIWQLLAEGKEDHFFVLLGEAERHRYRADIKYDGQLVVFRFVPFPLGPEQKELKERQLFLQPYQTLQGESLHRLLNLGERLETAPQTAALAEEILKNVTHSLGITRKMGFMENEPNCTVVDCKAFLTLLQKELAPFLKEKFAFTLTLSKTPENLPLKCDVRAFRSGLVSLIKYAIRHQIDHLSLSAFPDNRAVCVAIAVPAAEGYKGTFVSVEAGSISHDKDFSEAEYQLRRQQFRVLAQQGEGEVFRFCCYQPSAQTEVLIKDTLPQMMEEMLDVNTIEFSDML